MPTLQINQYGVYQLLQTVLASTKTWSGRNTHLAGIQVRNTVAVTEIQ